MKKCEKCGKDIEGSAKFCPHCGSPQTAAESAATAQPKTESVKKAPTPAPKPASGNGGGKKTLPIIAVAVIAVIALLVILLMPKNMEITPTDYVRVTVKGLDGEGKAELDFDTHSFISAIMAEKELKPAQQSEIEGLLQHAEDYFSFSSKEGLSNGDEITIDCSMPEKYLSDYKVKILDESLKYSVAGLIEKQEINLKDYFVVDFNGFEGKGYVDYYLNENEIHKTLVEMVRNVDDSEEAENFIRDYAYSAIYDAYTSMSVSQIEDLSNGDKVTVSCPINTGYDRIAKYGIVFLSEDVEYTVEGLEPVDTLALQDFVKAEFTGFDTAGDLRISVDEEKLTAYITENYPEGRNGYTVEDTVYQIVDFVDYNFTERTERWGEYSNGEAVQFSVEYDGYSEEPYLASVGFIVEDAVISTVVSGLEELIYLNAGEYVKAEFTGYDGAGDMSISVDTEKLVAALQEVITDTRNGYTAEEAAYQAADYIDYNFNRNADKWEGFANGEAFTVRMERSEPLFLYDTGIMVESGDYTGTVANLTAPQEVDLMDAIFVTFTGICPNVQVNVETNYDNPLSNFVTYDSYYNIPDYIIARNGDTLDITLEYDAQYALENGYKIINNQRSYEISGLDTYEYTLADVNDERLQESIEMARKEIEYAAMSEENSILKTVSGGSGIIKWDEVAVTLNKIVRFNLSSTYDDYNRTHYIYEVAFPVLYQGGATSDHKIYASYHIDNIIENVNGDLTLNEGRYNYFYYSMEEMDAALAEAPSNMGVREDSEITQNEWINEALTEVPTEVPAEEPVVAASSAQVEAYVIPEISSDIAGQAAAMIEYNGHRYYRFDTPMTWHQAYEFCNNANAHLATVSGYTEQTVLRRLINESELHGYWIGLTDENMEGQWQWVTGEAYNYYGWDNSQPDNANAAEHWAYISKSYSGKWNDNTADRENVGFILEVEAPKEDKGEVVVADSDLLKEAYGTDIDDWVFDTYGNCYYATRCYDASEKGRAFYELDGEYSRLTGITSIYEKAASGVSVNFAIFGDGKLLYKQTAITRETNPQFIDVDVSGVDVLTIETSNWGETSEDWLLFSDITLYPAEAAQDVGVKPLGDMFWSDSYEISYEETLWQDVYGEWSVERARFDGRARSYITLSLDGKFSTFDGTFTMGSKTTARTALGVEIYADGELVFSEENLNKMSGSVDFSLDVTGKNIIKIQASDAMEAYDSFLYLINPRFTEAAEEPMALGKPEGTALALQKPVVLDDNILAQVSAKAEFGDHKYYLFEIPVLWEEARQFCENAGGHLVVITSPQEQRRIERLLGNGITNEYWIGGVDLSDNEWVWVTGEPMEYTYWRNGQPDNYNGVEDYQSIYKDGTWNDNKPDAVLGFIMEISPDTAADYASERELAALTGVLTGSNYYDYCKVAYDWQGNEYLSSYLMNANEDGWATYELNGGYTSISGILSSSSESSAAADMFFGIFGDGKLLYAQKQMRGEKRAEKFTVDVTGVKTLTLRARSLNNERGRLLLNDVVLGVAAEPAVNAVPGRLVNMQLINSNSVNHYNRMFVDTYGNCYDGDIRFETNSNASAVYLLGGQYTTFTCDFAASTGTRTGSVMKAEVYGDEQLLFTQDNITKESGPTHVEVDVTGINNLKIVTSRSSDNYDAYLYLVGDVLQ